VTTFYAGFWRRIGAAAIDVTLGFLFFGVLASYVPESFWEDEPGAAGILVLVYLTIWFNYFAIAEWRFGQTFGKVATRIRVVSEDGSPLGWRQTTMRNLLRLVDVIGIGFLLIAFNKTRQRLGDSAAGTIVVPVAPRPGTQVPPDAIPPQPPAAVAAPAAPSAGAGDLASAPPPDPDTIVPIAPAPATPTRPAPRLPEITWSLGQTIGWFFGGFFIAVFSSLLVVPFDPGLESDAGFLAAQGLFGASLMTVSVGVASQWDLSRIREALGRLGLRRAKPSAFGWMLLALFGYYVFAIAFASLVIEPEQEDVSGDLGVGDENLLVAVLAVLLIVVLAPVSEELFFRGFLFAGLRRRFSLWPAVIASGLLFGLVHATTGLTTVPLLAVFGGLLAWFYAWSGSLWPCVVMHMINNGLALAAAGAEDSLISIPF
jgi:membrane protease YdiL (CAAX protease family)